MQKIMFNDQYGLTKVVLEGKKTQTRRLASNRNYVNPSCSFHDGRLHVNEMFKDGEISKYAIGEVIAVAQSYETICDIMANGEHANEKIYVSFQEIIDRLAGYKNKMFVKADLMPHQIRITNIRFERLQDITNDDCLKEGIKKSWWMDSSGKQLYGFGDKEDRWTSPREAYAALIDRISGKGTWERNPWVFVYDFERVK